MHKKSTLGLLSRLKILCRRHKLRLTKARKIIAQVLSSSHDHPDVEMLHNRVREIDPNISLVTVYRTLKLFERVGIIEKNTFGGIRARYEDAAVVHHDHLIDVSSGKVIEFRNPRIEALQTEIAREMGYKIINHRLELFGVPLAQGKKD